MQDRFSNVIVRGEQNEVEKVKITSIVKPEIVESVIQKWQSMINIIAEVVGVPSGLIMRLNEDTIEVFLKSDTEGNPYEVGEEAKLIYGLYCETVIGTQKKLNVPDASKHKLWKDNNPDVDINMVSYLGYPINWPDGEVFGTVCVLDNKENAYNDIIEKLLLNVKFSLERDLSLLLANKQLAEQNEKLEHVNEIKSKFLSLISHDVRGAVGTLNEFLKMVLKMIDTIDMENLKQLLTSLHSTTSYSYNLLENLLSWSKNDLLELQPNKEDIDLIMILRYIIDSYHEAITMKNQTVETSFLVNPAVIHADKKMLDSAMRNIFSNAVKYTKNRGTIKVAVYKEKGNVVVTIADNGIGMDAETLGNLFHYNDNSAKHGTAGEKSAGIGLILAKDFLDKNDAVVTVDSNVGVGTVFTIQF